ncbi:unnamed protein product, partial [Closterium sp. NIES-53]
SGERGKMAFLFLTRSTIPLASLWEQFFKGHEHRYSIYVHSSDPSFQITADNTPSPIFLGRQVPSGEVLWGDITMVDAERRLVEISLLDPDNLFFTLKLDPGGVSNYTVTFVDWTERKWHPKAYSVDNTTSLLLRQIKCEDRYIAWRPYWHRIRQSYKSHLVLDPSTGKPVKDYDNGYCALGSEHRHCFLFARKFMPSALPALLNMSQAELGF